MDMTPDHRPVILRVLELLRHNANDQGWVQVSNRALAAQLACSEGGIPDKLRRLQDEGLLTRGDTDNGGTWYQVVLDTGADLALGAQRPTGRSRRLPPAPAAPDLVTQLERLAELKRQGALTNDEFIAAKTKLLR
jgi:hypothetical protein